MKKTKTTFLLAEICLGILLLFCVHLIFEDEKPQKRVAVIVEKSGDEKWNSFMNGLKQANQNILIYGLPLFHAAHHLLQEALAFVREFL